MPALLAAGDPLGDSPLLDRRPPTDAAGEALGEVSGSGEVRRKVAFCMSDLALDQRGTQRGGSI